MLLSNGHTGIESQCDRFVIDVRLFPSELIGK